MTSEIYKEYQRVVFFDTETTGFDPVNDQIIEFAAIVCNAEEETPEQFDKYIQLEHVKEIPQKITDLTGIMPLMCAGGISEEELIRWISETLRMPPGHKALLVAHNAQFDLNFTARTFMRHMDLNQKGSTELIKPFTDADYLDTLTVYKDRAGYPHKLQSAIDHYGLQDKVMNTHRAIDDTAALKAVFDAMAAERDDLTDYVNVFGFNDRYGVEGAVLKKVQYYKQDFGYGMKQPEKTLPYIWNRMSTFDRLDNKDDWRQRLKMKKEGRL